MLKEATFDLKTKGKVYRIIGEVKDFFKANVNTKLGQEAMQNETSEEREKREKIEDIDRVIEKVSKVFIRLGEAFREKFHKILKIQKRRNFSQLISCWLILEKTESCDFFQVNKKIKELEEKPVDFGDDEDSTYMQESKYKVKAVQLYELRCKYTGETPNAERKYTLRKKLNVSGIKEIDEAISNFVYINTRDNSKRTLPEAIQFPEYLDILDCVTKCNKEKGLKLDTPQEKKIGTIWI